MPKAHVDPELEYLLETSGEETLVEAALLLRGAATPDTLLERLALTGAPGIETSFMERVGVLVVRANGQIIRQLIDQPEVELASAHNTEEDVEA